MSRHLPLAGLCLAVFLAMTGMGMAGVALPEQYLRVAGSPRAAGWLASAFAFSYMACQYPAGCLADRFGYRAVLTSGFLLMSASAVLYAMAQSPEALYVGRFLQGAGEAPVWASAPALLGSLYPRTRGLVIGGYNAAFHVGMMLGPLLAALPFAVLPFAAANNGAFAGFAVLSGAAALLSCLCIGRASQTRLCSGGIHAPRQQMGTLFRRIWPTTCALPFSGAAYGLLTSSLPVHLVAGAGFDRGQLARFLFATFLGLSLAQFGVGRLSDRFGRAPFQAAGLLATAGGFLALPHSVAIPAFCSAMLFGAGLGGFAVASMALVNEQAPQGGQATASGYAYLIWGGGYFAGPQLANLAGLDACAAVLTLGALGFPVLLRVRARHAARQRLG
ncbi:MAG: MFS transporter [Desulfovibrio sp.]